MRNALGRGACPLTAILVTWAFVSVACATDALERRERFNDVALRYAATPDREASADILAELLALVDDEVVDNLKTGEPFASAAFIQDRLGAFGEDWGGASFAVDQPERGGSDAITLVLVTVTSGEPRGALRMYRRDGGVVTVAASSLNDGAPSLDAWPRSGAGATQVLVSWLGTPTGRGSRPLQLELWRLGAPGGPTRVWSSAETFPDGLWSIDFTVARGQIKVRRELHYPGWTPGCAGQSEEEDVLGPARAGVALLRRRVDNAWHREVHAAMTRLLGALATGDSRALADLVPSPSLRARLPRGLELEPACDQLRAGPTPSVVVAATTRGQEPPTLVPWSLEWRRQQRGWRLMAADPVLK
jgi:hypothetical protein